MNDSHFVCRLTHTAEASESDEWWGRENWIEVWARVQNSPTVGGKRGWKLIMWRHTNQMQSINGKSFLLCSYQALLTHVHFVFSVFEVVQFALIHWSAMSYIHIHTHTHMQRQLRLLCSEATAREGSNGGASSAARKNREITGTRGG